MAPTEEICIENWSSKGAQESKLSLAIFINYDVDAFADANLRLFLLADKK
jgi:hypothetical protein